MSALHRKLETERAARDAAKSVLDTSVTRIRDDLEARGIGGRIADKVVTDATDAAFEAIDVAESNKLVIAGTLLALVAWLFRKPLTAWIAKLVGGDPDERESSW